MNTRKRVGRRERLASASEALGKEADMILSKKKLIDQQLAELTKKRGGAKA